MDVAAVDAAEKETAKAADVATTRKRVVAVAADAAVNKKEDYKTV